MAAYKIIVVEQAAKELEDACFYYEKEISGLGFEFEEQVMDLLEVVKKNPMLFPVKFKNIHEAIVKRFPFVITYEVVGKIIVVLAVFHTKRNPLKKANRKRK